MHLAGDGGNGTSGAQLDDRRRDSDKPLVVVIEDDQTQRTLLTRVLEADGYDVLAIGDGEIGLRAIVEHAPDLVLLDLNLPRMNGFEI